jgi:hypothetical protein
MADADYPAISAALDDPGAPMFANPHAEGWRGSVKVLPDRKCFDGHIRKRF